MANEISTEQNVFSISGAKVAKVTTNTSDTYATATAMELPELQEMDVTITKETKEATYGAGKKAEMGRGQSSGAAGRAGPDRHCGI